MYLILFALHASPPRPAPPTPSFPFPPLPSRITINNLTFLSPSFFPLTSFQVGCAGNSPEPGSTKIVAEITPGGIAAQAGLHVGDVILGINGVLALDLSHGEMVDALIADAQTALTVARSNDSRGQTFAASSAITITLTKVSMTDSFG